MLYNKNWDRPEVKADPLTIESVVAWLEKMPPANRYDYRRCDGHCLYGQYMAFHGFAWGESGACGPVRGDDTRTQFCIEVYENVAQPQPWTFGAALDRARKVLAEPRP